uniref:Uncharacterized protein n=1 Tax=Anguilla anguilla TaxID=7936 RepID=A0A0E9QQ75_ANGAN
MSQAHQFHTTQIKLSLGLN